MLGIFFNGWIRFRCIRSDRAHDMINVLTAIPRMYWERNYAGKCLEEKMMCPMKIIVYIYAGVMVYNFGLIAIGASGI